MEILTVDGDAVRLAETVTLLQRVFPYASIIAQDDALMAGKYAYNSPVDILFAAFLMKRMDGLQLADFVRRQHPEAWVFLTACPAQYTNAPTNEGEADGFLAEPLNEARLHLAMTKAEQNRSNKAGRMERIAPITLGRTNTL